MPIIFNPNGALDINTDSADLPEQVDGKTALSGAMRRCTNLSLDSSGIASTRKGTSKVNASAIAAPSKVVEQGGVRYALATSIYRNETSIGSGYSNPWSATLYNPFNVLTQTVYALNGTDRKKIEGSTVYEWGIEAPTTAPTCTKGASYACWTAADIVGLTGNNWLFTLVASDSSYTTYEWETAMIANADSLYPEATSYVDTFFFENVTDYGVTGKYEVVYTYCRYDSSGVLICESSPSPATETAIESNCNVTWAVPSDAQINYVRIYRSIANTAGSWYYAGVFAVADGNATISARDDELGTQVATTHDRPPAGHTVIGPSLGGQLYILKDNNLYYCLPHC